jgi:hypothetical protein
MDGFNTNPITAFAGGTKKFTSAATNINIPDNLLLAIFISFVLYNLAKLLDIDLATIVNFSYFFYCSSTNCVKSISTSLVMMCKCYTKIDSVSPHIETHATLLIGFMIPFVAYIMVILFDLNAAFTHNLIVGVFYATLRWFQSKRFAHKLHTALDNMLNHPLTDPDQSITAQVANVTGSGTITVIQGLPSDIPAADIRRYLETALYIHYQPQLQAHRDTRTLTNRTVPSTTEDAQIDTSSPGLWNDTCVRAAISTLSVASTSGSSSRATTPPATPLSTTEERCVGQ